MCLYGQVMQGHIFLGDPLLVEWVLSPYLEKETDTREGNAVAPPFPSFRVRA